MTVASGDPTLTFELKEFIKEKLIIIPNARPVPSPTSLQTQNPVLPAVSNDDPGAMLAGLL